VPPPEPAPRRARGALLAGAAALAVLVLLLAPAASAAPARPAQAPALARAFIVVDASTGQVLSAANDRQPLRVASLVKILTALVVRDKVPLGSPVPISARAAGMPALKINAKVGQTWNATDLLWCLLLPSANDAAVALAEKAGGGSLDGFVREMDEEAAALHLADRPVLRDPAGLDGAYAFDGGNYLSARDLAIATRAFLADPVLAGIVQQREYRFHGGDGLDHVIRGHNTFLTTYPGAVGVKTGYTEASGHSLVAAARRGSRTLIAVVIDSPDPDAVAAALLDSAFAAPATAQSAGDRLPSRPGDASGPAHRATAPTVKQAGLAVSHDPPGSPSVTWLAALGAAAVLCVVGGFLLRRATAIHRRGMRRLQGPSRRRHPSWPGRRW
jgi:D-alanyl-D-alanine carboxypeptidase (penicillin-binding protein 5/6)